MDGKSASSGPGQRGCWGTARRKRKGGNGPCLQKAIVWRKGKGYCYYHDPENPKRFGQGYGQELRHG